MFNNGDKWVNHYDRNYMKLQLIVKIIDKGEKLSFAGTISNGGINWLRIEIPKCLQLVHKFHSYFKIFFAHERATLLI